MTNIADEPAQLHARSGPRPDVQDMVVVHKVFRREFRLLPPLVRGVGAGDTARAGVVAGHARMLLAGLHMHHSGEDELLWPKLLERAAPSADLIRRMQAQHDRVETLTGQLDPLLTRWTATAQRRDSEELASILDAMHAALDEHLDAEEREILPLATQHLSVPEWSALGEHGTSEMTRAQLPVMFGAMLEDASPEERTLMLGFVPAPVRLLLRTVGAWQYRRYISAVRSGG